MVRRIEVSWGAVRLGVRHLLMAGGVGLLLGCEPSIEPPVEIAAVGAIHALSAPDDGGVLLSWAPVRGRPVYAVDWRAAGEAAWQHQHVGRGEYVFISSLRNDVAHEFVITASRDGHLVAADTLVATPRARDNCAFPDYLAFQGYFCSQAAADEWLKARGVSPADLRCRNQPVPNWGPEAPDCFYTAGPEFRMLLLRNADTVFAPSIKRPTPDETRAALRRTIWRRGDPFASSSPPPTPTILGAPFVGQVTAFQSATSMVFEGVHGLKNRVTHFVPRTPVPGQYAIYHEGHGGMGTEIAADVVDWLLERGWEVYAMDMPMMGVNAADVVPALENQHFDFWKLDDGITSPVALFMLPVKQVVDHIQATQAAVHELLVVGRSGGGWTSYMYAALDSRVTAMISIAGGRPMSQRLDAPWGALELGDYEQSAPEIFASIRHEDVMVAAGTKGALLLYGEWDPCCFRVSAGDPFLTYLEEGGIRSGRIVRGFADSENWTHGASARGFEEMGRFLDEVVR